MPKLLALLVLVSTGFLLPACSTTPKHEREFAHAAVAADQQIASRAGVEMLRRGGNAVDAAVATSFALSVVRPYSCGIGGGGFMVIHLADHEGNGPLDVCLDYRETAPGAMGPDYFERALASGETDASTLGGKAVGVPGTVAGLLYALDTYGTLDRRIVLEPAIRAAREGFSIDDDYRRAAQRAIDLFNEQPELKERYASFWEHHLFSGDIPTYRARLKLPEQARALELIASDGREAFYDGPIGEAVVEAVRDAGGDMTMADLRAYRVRTMTPIEVRAFGRTIVTMPPPSSGGVAIAQMARMIELDEDRRNEELTALIAESVGPEIEYPESASLDAQMTAAFQRSLSIAFASNAAATHYVVELMKLAFADRATYLADPDFADVPVETLVSDDYLRERLELIDYGRTSSPEHYGAGVQIPVDSGTSHLSVVDRYGNAVACTETINTTFGSKVPVPGFGFLLNNEMDDFLTVRGASNAYGLTQAEANLPEPGKRPLSSMSPTIVLDEQGDVEWVGGASGGPRIISATFVTMLRSLMIDEHERLLADAGGYPRPIDPLVTGFASFRFDSRPRFHHQWKPDVLYLEPTYWGVYGSTEPFEQFGYVVEERDVGVVQLIERGNGKRWNAFSDPRKGGRPAGY